MKDIKTAHIIVFILLIVLFAFLTYAGYFTLLSLSSYASGYSLDIAMGLLFGIDFGVLALAFLRLEGKGGRALYNHAFLVFWLFLAITLVAVPFIPSSTALRPNCNGPVPYGPHPLYVGVDYVNPIDVYTLNSISYSIFRVGVTYDAYFTVANVVPNAWPVDGFRFMVLNNTVASTYDAPIDYCP